MSGAAAIVLTSEATENPRGVSQTGATFKAISGLTRAAYSERSMKRGKYAAKR